MAKSKKPIYVSMSGIAGYPWLNKADTKFSKPGEGGMFKINLVIDPEQLDEQVRTNDGKTLETTYRDLFEELIEEQYQKTLEENSKLKRSLQKRFPTVDVEDEEGEPTGKVELRFKQNEIIKFKDQSKEPVVIKQIPTFDSRGKKLPSRVLVGGGSLVKVAFSIRPWYGAKDKEVGLRFDLQAVQVLELVEGGAGGRSASSFGFGQEDGYEAEEPEETTEAETEDDSEDQEDF